MCSLAIFGGEVGRNNASALLQLAGQGSLVPLAISPGGLGSVPELVQLE
jgi:hypothetical protein